MITNLSRSAISEIFGYVKLAHLIMYEEELKISYEQESKFEATRFRRPLPQGWNSIAEVEPDIALDRGFDKVIYISRGLIDLLQALASYHRKASSQREIIELILKEPDYFSNIERKWNRLDIEINDPRYLRITLDDWNNYTFQTFNHMLDFLEFKKEGRPLIVPAKVDRNFEGYSCSFLPKEYKVSEQVEMMRNGRIPIFSK